MNRCGMLLRSKKLSQAVPLRRTRIAVIVLYVVWAIVDIVCEVLESFDIINFEAVDTSQVHIYQQFHVMLVFCHFLAR